MSRAILALVTVFIFGCETKNDKLFWVDKPSGHENDLLFLVESTNVAQLQGDSLRLFLTQSEFENINMLPTSYKNFGQLRKEENFKVFVLLQEIDTLGGDYHFLIRTYDNNYKIIDSFELATWDEHQKKFCYGSINRDLLIERECDDKEVNDIMQITREGKIVNTSFHKP